MSEPFFNIESDSVYITSETAFGPMHFINVNQANAKVAPLQEERDSLFTERNEMANRLSECQLLLGKSLEEGERQHEVEKKLRQERSQLQASIKAWEFDCEKLKNQLNEMADGKKSLWAEWDAMRFENERLKADRDGYGFQHQLTCDRIAELELAIASAQRLIGPLTYNSSVSLTPVVDAFNVLARTHKK